MWIKQRFCPNCGSKKVEPDFSRSNVLGEMIFNQNKWICNECGHTGIMPSGEPDEDTEFDETEQETDTKPGEAYFWYYAKIMIPATLIFAALMILLATI